MRRHLTSCAGAILLLTVPVCAFGVGCGDVITTDTTLTADVGPCASDADPVLTLVGPATLDLNGHTVRGLPGAQTEVGIQIEGEKAKLRNGFVEDCESAAVVVGGSGAHRIENVIARNNSNDGFEISSSRNHLLHNTTMNNHDDGFVVNGSGNLLIGNAALDDSVGFSVAGEHNTLARNTAVRCDEIGFGINGSRHRVVDNRVVGSDLAGISVSGSGHLVTANQSIGNTRMGIEVTATATRLLDNVALGNARLGGDASDLSDASATCADNLWRRNVFATAEPSCTH